jgi:hypothetical protein
MYSSYLCFVSQSFLFRIVSYHYQVWDVGWDCMLTQAEYYIAGDNAYTLSQNIFILFSGAKKYDEVNRTFNFYLSQLRVRVEITCGLLTTKCQILRRALNYSSSKNARINGVCAKLHNFCIRMRQLDCDEFSASLHQIINNEGDPSSFGIIPVEGGGIGRILLDIYQLFLPTMTFKLMQPIHALIFFLLFSLMVLIDRVL